MYGTSALKFVKKDEYECPLCPFVDIEEPGQMLVLKVNYWYLEVGMLTVCPVCGYSDYEFLRFGYKKLFEDAVQEKIGKIMRKEKARVRLYEGS
jgi:uncharacterized protein (DUF2225 family)